MKSQINEIYSMFPRKIKEHMLNKLGLSDMDKKILDSVMNYDGDSAFHYQNTNIPKEKFERHLKCINYAVFTELTRLSSEYLTEK